MIYLANHRGLGHHSQILVDFHFDDAVDCFDGRFLGEVIGWQFGDLPAILVGEWSTCADSLHFNNVVVLVALKQEPIRLYDEQMVQLGEVVTVHHSACSAIILINIHSILGLRVKI